jgi:hypothetical protein
MFVYSNYVSNIVVYVFNAMFQGSQLVKTD